MPDEKDPIADTGMFRAFVAKGEAESTERKSVSASTIVAVLAIVVVVAAVVLLLAR